MAAGLQPRRIGHHKTAAQASVMAPYTTILASCPLQTSPTTSAARAAAEARPASDHPVTVRNRLRHISLAPQPQANPISSAGAAKLSRWSAASMGFKMRIRSSVLKTRRSVDTPGNSGGGLGAENTVNFA